MTLQEIVSWARELADAENDAHIRDDFVVREVNAAANGVYGTLLHQAGEERFRSSVDLTATPGSPSLAVTGGFVRLAGVLWVRDDGDAVHMDRLVFADYLQRDQASRGWGEEYRPGYVPGTDALTLWPTPAAAYTVRVWRVPRRAELVEPDDQFDGVNGFEELVALEAAIAILDKKKQPASQLYARLQRKLERIQTEGGDLDQTEGAYVRDTEPADGAWFRERP